MECELCNEINVDLSLCIRPFEIICWKFERGERACVDSSFAAARIRQLTFPGVWAVSLTFRYCFIKIRFSKSICTQKYIYKLVRLFYLKEARLDFNMIEDKRDLERVPSPTECKMSSKASAFSIAAIIGEQSNSRASDNVSPTGKFYRKYLCYILFSFFYLFESYSVNRRFNVFAKSIDSCQPAQSAQADMKRNFSLSLNFLLVKGPFYIMTQSVDWQSRFFMDSY